MLPDNISYLLVSFAAFYTACDMYPSRRPETTYLHTVEWKPIHENIVTNTCIISSLLRNHDALFVLLKNNNLAQPVHSQSSHIRTEKIDQLIDVVAPSSPQLHQLGARTSRFVLCAKPTPQSILDRECSIHKFQHVR